MKVIKPNRLAGLTRAVTLDGRTYKLAVGALTYVPLTNTRALAMETALWAAAAARIDGSPDEAYAKTRCEVLVSGSVVAPEGKALTVAKPRLVVERDGERIIDKSVAVFGKRYWTSRGGITDPESFTEAPVRWSGAYGGEGHPDNPSGTGFAAIDTDYGPLHPLPTVEDPKRLIVAKSDRRDPVGLGPIDLASPMRMRHAGRDYGGDWLKTRFPGPARDFDAHFFQSAPKDQWLPSPWTGTEKIRVEGMVPGPPIEGTLTPSTVKALVGRRGRPVEELEEYRLPLETVHVLPNEGTAVLIYRGLIDVSDEDADDIAYLMLAAESPDHPRTREHYRAVLIGRLDKERSGLFSLRESDLLPPPSPGFSTRPDFGELSEQLKSENRGLERAERGRKARLAAAQEQLRNAGFDVDDAFDEPDVMAPPSDPYDVDALLAYRDQMEKLSTERQVQVEAEAQQARANARKAFEEAGFDYDAEVNRAQEEAAGPPDFSALKHLNMLHEMARIAAEGNAPMKDLERDLCSEDYLEMIFGLEEQIQANYRASAHLMPPAPAADEDARNQMRVLVQAAKDGDESLAKRNLTGADLSGMDLRDLDLSGAMLEGANLDRADLMGANLQGAVLTRASLEQTALFGADLRDANLGDTTLYRTDLGEADLRGATFMKSHLRHVDFGRAKLEGASFLEATFDEALFTLAEAPKLTFYKVDLRRCHFAGTQMAESSFIECDIRNAMFTSARLDRSNFIHCRGEKVYLANASMVGTVFLTLPDNDAPSGFDDACLACADLTSANLQGTSFRRAEFEKAKLYKANLRKTQLEGARLVCVDAREALMTRTNLHRANLYGADLLGAIMQHADLRGADLRRSNMSRADLGLAWFDRDTQVDDAVTLDVKTVPARSRGDQTTTALGRGNGAGSAS